MEYCGEQSGVVGERSENERDIEQSGCDPKKFHARLKAEQVTTKFRTLAFHQRYAIFMVVFKKLCNEFVCWVSFLKERNACDYENFGGCSKKILELS